MPQATKKIPIDREAYRALSRAQRAPKESFSQVIRRASWPKRRNTCGNLLKSISASPLRSEDALNRLDAAQGKDAAPPSKWND